MAAHRTVKVKVGGTGTDVTDTDPYGGLAAAFTGESGTDFTIASTSSVTVAGITWDNIALHIECDPTGGTLDEGDRVRMNQSWTVDSTHRILISTKSSEWPTSFAAGSGLFRMENDVNFSVLEINSTSLYDSLVIDGLDIKMTSTGANNYDALTLTSLGSTTGYPGLIISRVIASNSDTGTTAHCFNLAPSTASYYSFWNCLADGAAGDGWEANGWHYRYYNCLSVNNGGKGFVQGATGDENNEIINCCAYNNTGNDFDTSATNFADANYNASQDTTAWDDGGATAINTITSADFENAGTDWTPASGSDLDAGGETISGIPAVDALGNTRPQGAAWAIGPIERVSISNETVIVPTGPVR